MRLYGHRYAGALRIAAYLVLALGMLFAVYRTNDNMNRIERQSLLGDARFCVTAWEGREDNRDMAEKVYRTNAETLITLSQSRPDPPDAELIERYRRQVDQDVQDIRAELPNPDCDVRRAERLLEANGQALRRHG